MRQVVGITGGALLALLAAEVPSAQANDLLQRRIGLTGGVRLNHGGLGADFPWTWQMIGGEAAWMPLSFGDNVRFGGLWWVQLSRYTYPGDGSVNAELSLAEMGLGMRLDWGLPFWVNGVNAQLSGEWYRASNPIPPGDDDQYLGAAVQLGIERVWSSSFYVGLGVSSALLPTTTASTTLTVHVGLGGR